MDTEANKQDEDFQESADLQNNQEQNQTSEPAQVSRRDFIKMASSALLSVGLATLIPKASNGKSEEEVREPMTPEIIHDVEVFGIKERITSLEQIETLYDQLDRQYQVNHPEIVITNKNQQRKELLPSDERYLEIVVRQSAYDSFQSRQQETDVDFVEWIKMHVDTMNMCFENAKPSSDMKAVLRRILVIQDEATKDIWDEEAFKNGKGGLLDIDYRNHFLLNKGFPFDTDTSWAIAYDYMVNTNENESQGFFWSTNSKNGQIHFGNPPGAKQKNQILSYPDRGSSLSNKQNIWLDFGLTHEWHHFLYNLPDEYAFDFHENGVPKLIMATGSFAKPWVSPFLSLLTKSKIEKRIRNDFRNTVFEPTYENTPQNVSLTLEQNISSLNIKIQRFEKMEHGILKNTYFPTKPDLESNTKTINLTEPLLTKERSRVLSLNYKFNGKDNQLYIPYIAFCMSKIQGKENAEYKIEMMSKQINQNPQYLEIVDESELNKKIDEYNLSTNLKPVAKMKIDGTNAWYLWFQQP